MSRTELAICLYGGCLSIGLMTAIVAGFKIICVIVEKG